MVMRVCLHSIHTYKIINTHTYIQHTYVNTYIHRTQLFIDDDPRMLTLHTYIHTHTHTHIHTYSGTDGRSFSYLMIRVLFIMMLLAKQSEYVCMYVHMWIYTCGVGRIYHDAFGEAKCVSMYVCMCICGYINVAWVDFIMMILAKQSESVCMYICVCVYIYIYICVCSYMNTYVCVYIYIHNIYVCVGDIEYLYICMLFYAKYINKTQIDSCKITDSYKITDSRY
jgi:hypothetical protein